MQNCPKTFSVATVKPLSKTVTCVSFLLASAEVNLGGGNPGIGWERGTFAISPVPLLFKGLLQNDLLPDLKKIKK